MTHQSSTASLSVLWGHTTLESPAGAEVVRRPDADEATFVEEGLREAPTSLTLEPARERAILCGFRLAAAFCLVAWVTLAALVAWWI